ncbi:hypothetical protein B566_EDAN015972 [Ephemera danica]|nr:hypothetical protein B566_EDAN015972 [Ephemera danica]
MSRLTRNNRSIIKMSGGTTLIKYSRVKSNVLAPVSLDPVMQHMNAWHMRQHYRLVSNARSREQAHVNPGHCNKKSKAKHDVSVEFDKDSLIGPTTRLSNNNIVETMTFGPDIDDSIFYMSQYLAKQQSVTINKPVCWKAHETSHAKQLEGQEIRPLFCPKILETKATSRLLQSRSYQQPRRTNRNRPTSAVTKDRVTVPKVWMVPSSSSSSSGDSAYEAGGSSPPSRGSTPRLLQQDSQDGTSRSNSSAASRSQPEPADAEHEKINPEPEINASPSVQPLLRNEQLEYLMFEHDLMNEIMTIGLLTNTAVKQVFKSHILAHSDRLQKDKMEEVVARLQEMLDIPKDDDLDSACYGLGGSKLNQSLSSESAKSVLSLSINETSECIQDIP